MLQQGMGAAMRTDGWLGGARPSPCSSIHCTSFDDKARPGAHAHTGLPRISKRVDGRLNGHSDRWLWRGRLTGWRDG
jgi:hypothetical protein